MAEAERPLGLVLTGGGARGAYQAGVLQGLAEIAAARGQTQLPFRVVTGASAGAINAAFLAATADQFIPAAPKLAALWASIRTREIFRTDALSFGRIGFKWALDMMFGGLKRAKQAQSLLDTAPLRQLIGGHIPFERIADNVRTGVLRAFEITATDYQTSESISFIMANGGHPGWVRARRRGINAEIGLDHVLASAAIPLLFPAVRIGERHYGDGCLRNPAPLSPAIKLGSRRLLIVGVRQRKDMSAENAGLDVKPTIGRVLSIMLNSVLMDSTEFDIERLARTNELVRAVPDAHRGKLPLNEIEFLHLTPSVDLGAFAADRFGELPDALRYLISGLGSREEASELVSYLFFEPEYCGYLVRLGRDDALKRRDELEDLMYGPAKLGLVDRI